MLSRPVIMTGLLGAAVAGPIAINEGPKHWPGSGQPQVTNAAPGALPTVSQPAAASLRSPNSPGSLIYESPAPIEGVGFVSLAELLRMDVTKEWVYARWARKTTGLADPGLFGVRVPVVTGTAMTDLAGSLSYYFNAQGRVDRLRFHGQTADTTALLNIAQRNYGMTPQPGLAGEQLLQAFENGKVLCELRTRPDSVLWSTSPHNSFVIDLELNRPGAGQYVRPRQLKPQLPPEPEQLATEAPKPSPSGAETDQPVTKVEEVANSLQNAKRPTFRWPN